MTKTTSKFTASKYIGKAYCEKVHVETTARLVNAPKTPMVYGHGDSVLGFVHAFLTVGTPAKASLPMAKTMAVKGSLVTHQRTSAKADSAPQA